MTMQIKNRWTGAVLFEGDFATMRICVEAAVKAGANLAIANLARANLARANLARANLAYANLARANLVRAKIRVGITLTAGPLRRATRSDGYEFFLWPTDRGVFVQAGCRWFTFEESWAHWCGPNAKRLNTPLGDETMDILTMFSLALDRVEDSK